jgi:hypothetical protein
MNQSEQEIMRLIEELEEEATRAEGRGVGLASTNSLHVSRSELDIAWDSLHSGLSESGCR